MSASSLVIQLLNGLAGASSLFMVAAGLSLIFGVTRIVNFAHGSLYMLGLYVMWSLVGAFGESTGGYWAAAIAAAVAVGVIGAAVEIVVLRRLYQAPELLQLLATFAVVLIIKDAALAVWGPEDLLGPRAPGLSGAMTILGQAFPTYDLFLVVVGPVVAIVLWLVVARTRFGILIRAATQDRDMVGALGVDQAWLFTAVFFLGSLLAGLGGALEGARQPAQLSLDLTVITDAFVVVVIGGMGSISGAFLAALIIGVLKALCIGLGDVPLAGTVVAFPKLTLVVEFIVMAIVLVWRPAGLLGRPAATADTSRHISSALPSSDRGIGMPVLVALVVLAAAPLANDRFLLVLLTDIAIFALYAVSLHFLMGPGGMISFGHAAYFGLGAYGAALLLKSAGLPMEAALLLAPAVAVVGALAFGWFNVRLSGVYMAMLSLAFAQIVWSLAFQWDSFTGGSNGIVGVWPSQWLAGGATYYLLTLALCAAVTLGLWRMIRSPFGYALRAGRDSPLRADSIGIDVRRHQWLAFVVAGGAAGLAGSLFAFAKGSISPETLAIGRSVDGLVMVLLGGVQSVVGPVVGATVFTWLQDELARQTDYWRGALGLAILLVIMALPGGLASAAGLWRKPTDSESRP